MKETLTRYGIANALHNDEYGGWSYAGALALADYLLDYEDSTGEELELDVVAFRCDFSEYGSLVEWAEDYWGEDRSKWDVEPSDTEDDDEWDDAIRDHIQDNSTLIEFSGGIIVGNF